MLNIRLSIIYYLIPMFMLLIGFLGINLIGMIFTQINFTQLITNMKNIYPIAVITPIGFSIITLFEKTHKKN